MNSFSKYWKLVRVEWNSTDWPSGVQPATWSSAGCQVSRRGTPPVASTTYTSTLPSYSPVNATSEPSGEKYGSVSRPTPLVRRRASPPSRPTIQRSPANEKTTCVRLTVGFCRSSGALGVAAAGLGGSGAARAGRDARDRDRGQQEHRQ